MASEKPTTFIKISVVEYEKLQQYKEICEDLYARFGGDLE